MTEENKEQEQCTIQSVSESLLDDLKLVTKQLRKTIGDLELPEHKKKVDEALYLYSWM